MRRWPRLAMAGPRVLLLALLLPAVAAAAAVLSCCLQAALLLLQRFRRRGQLYHSRGPAVATGSLPRRQASHYQRQLQPRGEVQLTRWTRKYLNATTNADSPDLLRKLMGTSEHARGRPESPRVHVRKSESVILVVLLACECVTRHARHTYVTRNLTSHVTRHTRHATLRLRQATKFCVLLLHVCVCVVSLCVKFYY